MSINDVFCELQKLTKAVLNIHHTETRKNDISASILDIHKAKNTLGFEAKMPFKNGLKRTLSLYEKRYPKLQEALVLNDT
jgi:nucleoside-diphosphate-sugar epimerase